MCVCVSMYCIVCEGRRDGEGGEPVRLIMYLMCGQDRCGRGYLSHPS